MVRDPANSFSGEEHGKPFIDVSADNDQQVGRLSPRNYRGDPRAIYLVHRSLLPLKEAQVDVALPAQFYSRLTTAWARPQSGTKTPPI
jgi:hypothetical protein